MSRIFWDTNLYIYLFEKHPDYAEVVGHQRRKMLERKDELVTSALTLGEIQVHALKLGKRPEALEMRALVEKCSIIAKFDSNAADAYAMVRASTDVKGPDAIQLACACAQKVDFFVTNDKRLHSLPRLDGIEFIVPLDRVPLL